MSTLAPTSATLSDWSKRLDPDGGIASVAEILNQKNEILDDMQWIMGNLPTGHRGTVRTGLPSGTWRQLNYGVQPAKSTTTQVTDTCGMLETYSEVDKALADLNGNSAAWRLSEDKAFLEGLAQQMAATLFYGNTATNPERFMGLAPRFNTLVAATAQTANNVVSAGGSGSDNTSIWLVVWSDETCAGIFPKGSQAGLQMRDLGEQTLLDSATPAGRYQGYRTHFKWDAGLMVKDWRYVARICNIDVSELAGPSPADLPKYMIKAANKIPSLKSGRAAWYMNRTAKQWLDIQRQMGPGTGTTQTTNSNVRRTLEESNGRAFPDFMGIPIRLVDQITNAEATIA
jgi:hypothetical protein